MSASRALLAGGRWHFQHGPIDLVIGADGDATAVAAAHDAAWRAFPAILPALVAELALLRQDVAIPTGIDGPVARRMQSACRRVRGDAFLTPMAAVAGAVAEEVIGAYRRPGIERAWVNNGGDIALQLAAGASVRIGLFADPARLDARQLRDGLELDGRFVIEATMPVRGIATSGWRGRSFSLGIADSVTVLAASASLADAAATVIANAVNVADPGIRRRPACELKDDTDLGATPVTVAVPPLAADRIDEALAAGLDRAQALQSAGLIAAAVLTCQRRHARLPMPGPAASAADRRAPPVATPAALAA